MKKNYGTFGVEMRAYGQKFVKFCIQTHRHTDTRVNLSSIDEMKKYCPPRNTKVAAAKEDIGLSAVHIILYSNCKPPSQAFFAYSIREHINTIVLQQSDEPCVGVHPMFF